MRKPPPATFACYKEALIRIFYPETCGVCRKILRLNEMRLCENCKETLDRLEWPWEEAYHPAPLEHLSNTWAVYSYESPLKELLRAVKYSRKEYLLKIFQDSVSRLALAVVSEYPCDAVLPIPIDPLKRLHRHFNQSETLARMVGKSTRLPVLKNILVKPRMIHSQTSLSRRERSINTYGAFRVRAPRKVKGKKLLLLNDVFTTGSTANEAARILKAAGALRVDFLALARTGRSDLNPSQKETASSPDRRKA
ncbi:MAG: DNA utilization protein GntX [Candidatus Omnitrophica bacterium ADurb.Bin277]|nr:MAG: DNA utilization protein GntX [Candidatus Omnitrophica bacterium ADurb.Bin277]